MGDSYDTGLDVLGFNWPSWTSVKSGMAAAHDPTMAVATKLPYVSAFTPLLEYGYQQSGADKPEDTSRYQEKYKAVQKSAGAVSKAPSVDKADLKKEKPSNTAKYLKYGILGIGALGVTGLFIWLIRR